MKSKKQIKTSFVIAVCAILVTLIIPTAVWMMKFYTSISDEIDSSEVARYATFEGLVISFWGLGLNLFLAYIAYSAFINFGVKQQFHNKQLTIVTDLTTDISSTNLRNMLYETFKDREGQDSLVATGYDLSFYEIALAFKYDKFKLMCVRTRNIEDVFPFLKYRKNPILPPAIATELDKFYRPLQYDFGVQKEDLPKDYVIIMPPRTKVEDTSPSYSLYKLYDTPSDFRRDTISLRNSIIAWFQDYGATELNI